MDITKKINLPQAAKLTSPNMIAYAVAKTSYSGEIVRNNQKVIVTVPGAEIAEAVMGCGSTTGRNTDKASKFGIEIVCTIMLPAAWEPEKRNSPEAGGGVIV